MPLKWFFVIEVNGLFWYHHDIDNKYGDNKLYALPMLLNFSALFYKKILTPLCAMPMNGPIKIL
jgi:hypothetical protein